MVGVVQHPQSNIADFYRELGDLFNVPLKPHNRWAGFRDLRARFVAHIESTTMRPVLLCDEAQEMNPVVLGELRLLASTRFDSRSILGVVLCGDGRLPEMLRRDDLVPLGSRIRTRMIVEAHTPGELVECLTHRLCAAGNPGLVTPSLVQTLCEHALGNPRVLLNTASREHEGSDDQSGRDADEVEHRRTQPPLDDQRVPRASAQGDAQRQRQPRAADPQRRHDDRTRREAEARARQDQRPIDVRIPRPLGLVGRMLLRRRGLRPRGLRGRTRRPRAGASAARTRSRGGDTRPETDAAATHAASIRRVPAPVKPRTGARDGRGPSISAVIRVRRSPRRMCTFAVRASARPAPAQRGRAPVSPEPGEAARRPCD